MKDHTNVSESRRFAWWVGLGCAMLMTVSVSAQPPAERGADVWTHLSAELDADQDGTISREEFDQATSRFPRLDSNGDGVLTEDDFAEGSGFGHKRKASGPMGAGLVRGADVDRDGTITSGEWDQFLLTADPDGDGVVDPADLRPSHPRRRGGRPGFSGPGFSGPGVSGPGEQSDDSAERQELHQQRRLEMQQRMLDSVDRNQNGNLDIDDMNTIFGELDLNTDGELSGDELPQRRRGPRRGGRGGPGSGFQG